MYAIHKETSFYAGTYSAEQSRNVAAFDTKAEAEEVLALLERPGSSILRHGEYAAPSYTIKGCTTKVYCNLQFDTATLLYELSY